MNVLFLRHFWTHPLNLRTFRNSLPVITISVDEHGEEQKFHLKKKEKTFKPKNEILTRSVFVDGKM